MGLSGNGLPLFWVRGGNGAGGLNFTFMQEKLEFWLVLAVARPLGWMPRGLARCVAGVLAWSVYVLHGRLRRVGQRNLEMAYPELSSKVEERSFAASSAHWVCSLSSFAA